MLWRRYALWWSLIRGCEKVEKACSERKADPKEALLDWFGVGVKAQEISAFVKRMDLLAHRVGLLVTRSCCLQSPHRPTRTVRLEGRCALLC